MILVALGLVVGYLLGAREPSFSGDRGPGRRRSAAPPWFWALAVLVMAFALGLVVGQIAGELSTARRAVDAVAGSAS